MENRINKHRKSNKNKKVFLYFFVFILMAIIGIYLVHAYQSNYIENTKEKNNVSSKGNKVNDSSHKKINGNNVKVNGNNDNGKKGIYVNNNGSGNSSSPSNEAIQDEQYHILRAYNGKQIYVDGIPEYDLSNPNNPKLSQQFLKWESNRYNVQPKDYWGNATNVKSPSNNEEKSNMINSNEQDSQKENQDTKNNNNQMNNNNSKDDSNSYEVTEDNDNTVNVKNNKTGDVVQKNAVSNPDWDYVHDKQIDYSNSGQN